MKPADNQRKVDRMARKFGPGELGQDCRGCVSLIQAPHKGDRAWVCHAAGDVVWNLSWQSCGAYRKPAEYDSKQMGRA